MFNNKRILVTGGTGSFGKRFSQVILSKYKVKKLVIFSFYTVIDEKKSGNFLEILDILSVFLMEMDPKNYKN